MLFNMLPSPSFLSFTGIQSPIMKRLFFAASLLAAFSFTSCSDEAQQTAAEEDSTVINTASNITASPAGTGAAVTPVTSPQGSTPQTIAATGAQGAKTAAGTNPPHGQPGHTCDLPVGAPLDGSAKPQAGTGSSVSVAAPPPQPQAQPQKAITAQPATTAPGMNPPHGQPGHRCEIAVGAPLNSAPAK